LRDRKDMLIDNAVINVSSESIPSCSHYDCILETIEAVIQLEEGRHNSVLITSVSQTLKTGKETVNNDNT